MLTPELQRLFVEVFLFMKLTIGDLDIAGRTVYGEARGESFAGKLAVAHVLVNRVNKTPKDKRYSLASVSTEWLQFSVWREGDPNFNLITTVNYDNPQFQDCLRAVLLALKNDKMGIDPTEGSTHYHTKNINPFWAKGEEPVYEVGYHVFYNTVR